jgi:hypothetical protein
MQRIKPKTGAGGMHQPVDPPAGWLTIRWSGTGYNPKSAWIRVDYDLISDLEDFK